MLETSSNSSMVVMAPSSSPAELVVCHNSDKRKKSDLLYKKSTKMHHSFSSMSKFTFAAVFITFIITDLTLLFSPSSLHVHAHIALTYPPARRVDLDFLDNIRTPGPCGMPRGLSPPLELEEGSTFNVTWHLGLLHRGGFKLELLDTNYTRVALLTVSNTANNFIDTNPAQQRYTVTLPANFTCDLCTIRLTRQALEWSVPVEQVKQDNADEYLLRSCADVNIVKAVTDQQRCTHRGTWTDGQCICDRFYAGDSCQYENECDRDSDCGGGGAGGHGACIDIQSTSTQQASKMCFCHAGWFGYQCRKESILRSRFFDTTLYRNATVGPDFTLFWRILPEPINEIEMVVYARSQSYVAVGWRPQLLDGQCRAQVPQLPSADLPIISAAAAAAMRAAVESGSPPSPTLMPRMQLPPAAASVGGGVALHPMDCTDIIIGRARGSLSHVADYYTRDRSTPRFDETFGGQQSLTAAYGYEDTTNGFMTVMFRRPLQAREPTDHSFDPNFPLMHFVWSRGQDPSSFQQQDGSNISSNFYRRDELKYHGNSRTARGVANINFFSADAAPASGAASADSAADVQQPQQPPPSPHQQQQQKQPQSPSASLSMPPFYNLDKSELMTLNDDDPATLQLVGRAGDTVPLDRIYQCRGEFKDPVGCDTFDCAYIAKWQYIPDHDSIWFMIQTRNDGKWHGVGFSDDRRMPNTDVIIMWLRGSQLRVSDMWLSDYAPPTPNDVPSIMNVTAKLVGNMLKIEFVRPRLTVDKRMDFQMTDEHCPYFVFPTAGGEIDAQAGVIRKHSSTPLVSEQRICVTTCEKAHEMVQLQMDAAKANELTRGSSAAAGAQPAAATRGGTTAITVTRLGNNSTQIVIEPPASHSEASSLFNNPVSTTTSVAPIRLSDSSTTTMIPTSSPSSVPNREGKIVLDNSAGLPPIVTALYVNDTTTTTTPYSTPTSTRILYSVSIYNDNSTNTSTFLPIRTLAPTVLVPVAIATTATTTTARVIVASNAAIIAAVTTTTTPTPRAMTTNSAISSTTITITTVSTANALIFLFSLIFGPLLRLRCY